MSDDQSKVTIAAAVDDILGALGEHPRAGLTNTPARVAGMFMEMTEGLRTPCPKVTTFDRGDNDQMITVLDLDYWSMCEHHLVPFYGKVHIGYLPEEKIAGLSKFGRVVEWVAKRPQIQEQMTVQIATVLNETVKPKGLIVVVEGTHLCMSMRGIRKENHRTLTSAIRGEMDKGEFFDLLKIHRRQR